VKKPRRFERLNRRDFLRSASSAGLSLAALPISGARAATVNRVIVIGAGVVGASIAYHLSRRGCEVTVIDQRGPASQASGNTFAWINASYFDRPDAYYELRTESLHEYRRLAAEAGFDVDWGGSLEWYHDRETEREVAEGVRRTQHLGAPARMIDAEEVARLEPRLKLGGEWQVAWSSRDGAVDASAMTNALLNKVRSYGGDLVFPARAGAIRETVDGMAVETGVDTFTADLVVAATGIGANDTAAMAGIRVPLLKPPTPGIIVTTSPMPPLLNTISYTSDSHFFQRNDGRVIIGEKLGPPDTTEHAGFLQHYPNRYPSDEIAAEHAARVIATASRYVPGLADAIPEQVGVGWRPLPVDGLPIIGRTPQMPGVYLASMHSGVTLAPIVGRLAAMEILDGLEVSPLEPFRVQRLQA
jgi:glycine/D-amino acid oxidase-like deaminating enzyme